MTISRRFFVMAAALLPGFARPQALDIRGTDAVVHELVGDREVAHEGVTLTLPKLAETGNSVPISIAVDSPMTPDDHVEAIHIIVPANPRPVAASYHLTPASGRAAVSSRIRLARTQQVTVLAELSTGRVLGAEQGIVVTLGACVDELWVD